MVTIVRKNEKEKEKGMEKDIFRLSLFLYRAQNLPPHLFYLQI